MLDQKVFGEKLRNHRKKLGMTQEEVAEKVGVSPQAISKWEAGDCLPDCFNLKTISDVYKISADVLLETESSGDLDAVSSKIEQLATEFVWSIVNHDRYNSNLRQELGEDLWEMWKGIYFACNGIYVAIRFSFKKDICRNLVNVTDRFQIEAIGQAISCLPF